MKNLIVISAPSGAGKSTLCRKLQKVYPKIRFSVSCTTRSKRHYEKDGYDYKFVTYEDFNKAVQDNDFIEFEEVHSYLYGTPRANIEEVLDKNDYLLLEVDVKGAMKIKAAFPERTVTIFITLSSIDEFRKRLQKRGSDTERRITKRLERIKLELEYKNKFDHCIENDDIDKALTKLINIIGIEKKGEIDVT